MGRAFLEAAEAVCIDSNRLKSPRSPWKWTLTGKFWIAVGGCHCNFAKSEKGFFGAQPDESFRPNKP